MRIYRVLVEAFGNVRTLAFVGVVLSVAGCSSTPSGPGQVAFDLPAAIAQAKSLCAQASPFLPVVGGLAPEALIAVGFVQSFCGPLLAGQVPATFDAGSVGWLQGLLGTLSQARPATARRRM